MLRFEDFLDDPVGQVELVLHEVHGTTLGALSAPAIRGAVALTGLTYHTPISDQRHTLSAEDTRTIVELCSAEMRAFYYSEGNARAGWTDEGERQL